MATVKTYGDGKLDAREVDASVIASRVLGRTLKEALVGYEANQRQGTAKTKERGEVAGSSKKPWKQKHTGRARAGHKRSPLWRGGGTVFGPRPRDFTQGSNRKQRRVALASALLGKLEDGEVMVVDGFPTREPSTKEACRVLQAVGATSGALVVTAGLDRTVWMSLRNVPRVDVLPLSDLNARAMLLRRNVIFTPAAFDQLLQRRWSQKREDAQEVKRG
ncbi:MAG: 50S ribosomal protein L4 [Planctomycetota bacterium]